MALFGETRYGGAKRLYYFARELAKISDLHLFCIDGCREWPQGGAPPAEFRNALYLSQTGRKSLWRRFLSLPIELEHEVHGQKDLIAGFLAGKRFDATLLAFPLALTFLGKGWDRLLGKVVYLEDDLLLESYRKAASRGGGSNPASRLKNAWRLRQGVAYYRRKLRSTSAFICISKEEQTVIRSLFPALQSQVLKYGIPLEGYPRLEAAADPKILGFIGNYGHLPNIDAAMWLATELFPVLEEKVPDLRLVLAGRGMTPELKAFCRGQEKITLQEDVSRLEDFYGSIGIFVNAVRTGRGLRTKVVEAVAFGRPVLSTPLGAEGLEELRIPLWESAQDLAERITELLAPHAYKELADANREAVEAHFTMESMGRQLLGILAP